jgi:hypothetical protein
MVVTAERKWVVLGGVVVLALIAAGALVLLRDSPPSPEERAAAATSTGRAWLEAWAKDDRAAMRRLLANRSPELDATVDELRSGLGASQIEASARSARLRGAGAVVPFDASITLGDLGTWRYRGEVPVVDTDEGWLVSFSPAALHPDLVDGRRLALVLAPTPRGRLLYDDGTPITTTPELRSIVGSTGPISAERAKELGAEYRTGDVGGVSGLQAGYERQLGGKPSAEVRLLRGDEVVRVETSFPGTPGQDVRTTLDQRALAAARSALGTEGNAAALVAIQPSTGAVRAIANRPSNGYDRALLGRYPPGSTFKVITSVALLSHGVVPTTRISCPKEIAVNGRTIRNAEEEELGEISFADAFAHSCNTAFIQLAQRLQGSDLEAAASSLGFGVAPDIGLSAATASFPEPHGVVDLVSSAIGQGRVLATPLQMATVAASIAAGGFRPPHLQELPAPPALTPLPEGVAATMQDLMRRVVASGTGKKARLAGAPVAGKTGTAEFGTAAPLHTHAWFIAFRGDLALAVIVEDGGFGGDAAAPIAADFYRRVG